MIADPTTHTAWRPSVVEFTQLSEGPLTVGSRIREVLRWRGRQIEIADRVTAFEPSRRLGIHGGWKAAEFDFDLVLRPQRTATQVTFDWVLYPKSLVMHAAAPFLGSAMRKATDEEAEGLKRYVETGAAATPGT